MPVSMNSLDSESNLLDSGKRKTFFVQMSGPLGVDRDQPSQNNATVVEIVETSSVQYPSCKGTGQSDCSGDNDAGQNEHLLKSGQLGICNHLTYPSYCNREAQQEKSKASRVFNPKIFNALYSGAMGWARRFCSFLHSYVPEVMNPHHNAVQQWNKFVVNSCLLAILMDPMFFFLLSVQKDNKCIAINWPMTTTLMVFRSITDFIYLLHMLLQFRLAYVDPESRGFGTGDIVDHPKKIALRYLSRYFLIDLLVILPIPQIMILLVLPKFLGSSVHSYLKNHLSMAVFVHYFPRWFRFLHLLSAHIPRGSRYVSAWVNYYANIGTFLLSGHVVGSFWYLFGLQRVDQCLRDACLVSGIHSCMKFLDCGHQYGSDLGNLSPDPTFDDWITNVNVVSCFNKDGFPYGIYDRVVNLATTQSVITRIAYALFWGFQQIITLSGNQTPSYFFWEVVFTMAISGLGLLFLALLIGNLQNFLQAPGQRRLEMSLRRLDVEQWMTRRRLPKRLKRQIRQAERFNWVATRGINEEMLLDSLPEDLQRDVRRLLFSKYCKNVCIFSVLDEPILDSICERLRQTTYIKGRKILDRGGLVEQMVFIVCGKMGVEEDGSEVHFCEGDVCGEELFTWCLEYSSETSDGKKFRILGQQLISKKTVTCLTNVEAFILRAVDIKEIISLFPSILRNPKVQRYVRYSSPYWRRTAARHIQIAWRYRKKHRMHADTINA